MLKKIILAAFALLASVAVANAQEDRAVLNQSVAEIAASCPQDMGDGSTFDNVKLTDTNFEMYMTMAIPADQFGMLEQAKDMLRSTMLQAFMTDNNIKSVCKMVSANGLGMKIIISCKADPSKHVTVNYTAQDLANAIK